MMVLKVNIKIKSLVLIFAEMWTVTINKAIMEG